MMLQTLLSLAGEETAVIVMSDHGYYNDHLRPDPREGKSGPVDWHRPFGIFAAQGAGNSCRIAAVRGQHSRRHADGASSARPARRSRHAGTRVGRGDERVEPRGIELSRGKRSTAIAACIRRHADRSCGEPSGARSVGGAGLRAIRPARTSRSRFATRSRATSSTWPSRWPTRATSSAPSTC